MKIKRSCVRQFPFRVQYHCIGGTGRDDISMQFASRDFRPCWIYTWVAVKLPLASPQSFSYRNSTKLNLVIYNLDGFHVCSLTLYRFGRWCITCPQGVCPKILVSFARRFCIICPKILYHLPEDFVSFARRAKKCVVCPKHTVSFARRNHLPARIARHTLKSSSLKIRFYCKGQK